MIILLVAAVVVPVLLVALGMDINARRRGTQASPPRAGELEASQMLLGKAPL